MPIVSAKRQVTLPIAQCREAGIGPGDEYVSYVDNQGRITILKQAGAARGLLNREGQSQSE
jgi:bifunctional DNA-binding transcriptional regulator/antitoxin component of YhaV-PrlF toxin-antitoxin module